MLEIVLVLIEMKHFNNKSFLHNRVFSDWNLSVVSTLYQVIFHISFAFLVVVVVVVVSVFNETIKMITAYKITREKQCSLKAARKTYMSSSWLAVHYYIRFYTFRSVEFHFQLFIIQYINQHNIVYILISS